MRRLPVSEQNRDISSLERSNMIQAEELTDLIKDLQAASGREAEELVTEVIHATTERVGDLAKAYAPKDTHELANSIETTSGPTWGRVRATAPHAVFVEFGTWQHNIHNPKSGTYTIRPVNAQALRFEVGGEVVFAKKVEHPGIEPQPFVGRAANEVVDEFAELLSRAGIRMIVRSV